MLAARVERLGVSETLRISALAAELTAAGHDVIDLGAGQPDFPTPDAVKLAGKRAIDANRTRYTANEGLIELRRAIAETARNEQGLAYEPDQILVSPGAKACLYFAVQALFEGGDEVLVPSPHWVTYPEQIRLAGATPVLLHCAEARGFKLDPAALAAAVGPRTRGLLLNYPCNPTGACYSRDELEPIARICVERGLWVVADEIYGKLVYDGRRFTSIAALGKAIVERTVVVGGMSKTYSMTGWRIGYAAGPRAVIAAMARLQSHVTSNATSISQWASVEALTLDAAELDARRREFERRRDLVVERLRKVPGVRCERPEGAFYAFPNVAGLFGERRGRSLRCGADVAEFLLAEAQVAVVPGDAFGAPEHVRISYAVPYARLELALERIADVLARSA